MPLTEVEKHNFSMHFLLLDKDSDGLMPVADICRLLRSVGLYPSPAEVLAVASLVDSEGTGTVSQERLLAVVESMWADAQPEESAREAFRVLDDKGTGYLTSAQLRHILLNLGPKLSHAEADEVIADAEKDSEGHIAIDDFVTMLLAYSAFGETKNTT